MTLSAFQYQPEQEPPFTIYIEHRNKTRDGHWRPAAYIRLTSSLRTSGLVWALPPEDLKSFLVLLTFLTPNGSIVPTVPQLATALQLSETKTRDRMGRLVAARWHGQPIVLSHQMGNGLEAFTPAPGLLPLHEECADQPINPQAPYRATPREVIIEQSRQLYAHPRAEVEQMVGEQLGHKIRDDDGTPAMPVAFPIAADESDPSLRGELQRVGLRPDQVNELLASFDTVRIRRQLMWLPYRTTRNPVVFLLAAIKDDYAAPTSFRRSQAEHNSQHDSHTTEQHLIEQGESRSTESANLSVPFDES